MRQLVCTQLEDRTLMNAAPIDPSMVPPPTQDASAAATAPAAASGTGDAAAITAGNPAAGSDASASPSPTMDNSTASTSTSTDTSGANATQSPHEVVFVDSSVQNHDAVVSALDQKAASNPNLQVVLLDDSRDGVDQISAVLTANQGLDSIHILTSSTDGVMKLGGTTLSADSVAGRADEIGAWHNALDPNGQLLIYGCDPGASSGNQALLNNIASTAGTPTTDVADPMAGVDPAAAVQTAQVVLIDSELQDSQMLENAVLPGAKLFVYDSATQSADQVLNEVIQWAQANNTQISSLSIMGHGHSGTFELGSQWIDDTNLSQTAAEWQALSGVLAAGATIDLFACDVASVSDGQDLVDQIAQLTGADVYASTNTTGMGGDWTLEFSSGAGTAGGQPSLPLDYQALDDYDGQLGPINLVMTSSTLAYTENDPATVVDSAITPSGGAGNYTSATITISSNYDSGKDVLAFTNQVGITGSWNATTGVLTLTGTTSHGNWQTALRAVTYQNTSDNPSALTRTITVVVNDGVNTSGTATRNISVTAVNDAPTLAGANNMTTINEDATSNSGTLVSALISGQATDPDSAVLGIAVTAVDNTNGTWQYTTNGGTTWTAFSSPSTSAALLLAADANTSVRFVPNANWNGTVTNGITFQAWDQTTGTAGGTVDLSGTYLDQFSSASYSNSNGTGSWGTSWTESDANGGGATGGNIQITGGQLRIWKNHSGDNIYRQVNLSNTGSATLSFDYNNTITDGAAIAVQISSDGGSTYTTLYTFDKNNNTLTGSKSIDISAYATSNTYIRAYVTNGGGSAQYLYLDNVQISYNRAGGAGAFSTASASASLTVNAVNDQPVRTAGTYSAVNVNEDANDTTAVTLGLSSLTYGPGGGSDEASQTLTYKITGIPSTVTLWLADGATQVSANSTLTLTQLQGLMYKTIANANGTGNITWSVQDNGGTANGGADTLNESMTVSVTAVNDQPVRTAGTVNNLTVLEDSGATSLGLSSLAYGPGGGSDEASQTLTYKVTAVPASTLGNIVLADGATVVTANTTYTLAQLQGMQFKTATNANGSPATFSWSVQDNGGTANGGVDTLNESLTVSVTAVNDQPVRTAGTANNLMVLEDSGTTSLGLSSLAYGPGGGSDEASQTLTYTVTAVPASTLGNIVLADGTTVVAANTIYTLAQIQGMQFKTAANANGGPATFSWKVQDSGGTANGGVDTLNESLAVSVTAVNDQPVRTAGTVNNLAVLEDSGTTSLGLGSLAYGPGGGSDEASQTLTYTVTAVPVSTLGNIVLADGTTVVAANTTYTLAQIQGMQLKTASNANGGPATFSWKVQDNGGTANGGVDTLNESLNVSVTAVNDQPVRTAGAVNNLTVLEDSGTTSLGLSSLAYGPGGGSDEASQTLTYTVTTVPASTLGNIVLADGTTVVAANTTYSLAQLQGMQFKTVANANGGPATFSWKAQDNGGTANGGVDTLNESLTVSVTAVNDQPVRTAGTANNLTVLEDSGTTSLGLSSLAYGPGGGSDEASQTLTYKVTAVPASTLGNIVLADGSTVVTANTTYTLAQLQGMQFKTAANANGGSATFSWSIQDSGGTANGGVDTLHESLAVSVT
ncbi:MAG: DUF4347 domain-containing protein, partial [Planctomycetes bacterium]|nr:DUF4347 domain-containing protein [Planctomycetota bacterium]